MTDAATNNTRDRSMAPVAAGPSPGRPTLRTAADVVAAVPYLLGHHPAESLVALGRRRAGDLGVVCRVDLPTAAEPETDALAMAQRVVAALVADGDVSVVLVVYEGSDPPQPLGAPARAVLEAASDSVVSAGLGLIDTVRVGPLRWRSLSCADEACCPADGAGVAESRLRDVALDFVIAGRSPAADREALEAPPPPARVAARRSAAAAATRWRRGRGAEPDLVTRTGALREWVGAVEEYRRAGRFPAATVTGRLAAGWSDDLRLRDACMVAVLPGSGMVPDAIVAGVAADLEPVLRERACAGSVEYVAPLLRHMSSHLVGDLRGSVLAVHAWLAWVSGAGAAAGDLAARAVSAQPGQRLACLVLGLLERAVPPDWAVGRPAP